MVDSKITVECGGAEYSIVTSSQHISSRVFLIVAASVLYTVVELECGGEAGVH